MNYIELLNLCTHKLIQSDISTARLDTLVLMEDTLGIDRSLLLAHPNAEIDSLKAEEILAHISKRSAHVPLAYIRGKTEFYGREFKINNNVLVPRPETEDMIELLLKLKLDPYVHVVDIGTGSGAIGITVALELPHSVVDLTDIVPKALITAKSNVDLFTLNLNLYKSNLLSNLSSKYDIFMCNLPYVPDGYSINRAAKYEPYKAIFGGSDGLQVYRNLFNQIQKLIYKPLYILTESFAFQHDALVDIASLGGYKLEVQQNFICVFKYK